MALLAPPNARDREVMRCFTATMKLMRLKGVYEIASKD
jgi:hypothetical protein